MQSLSSAPTNIFFSSGTTGNAKMIERSQASMGLGSLAIEKYVLYRGKNHGFFAPNLVPSPPRGSEWVGREGGLKNISSSLNGWGFLYRGQYQFQH